MRAEVAGGGGEGVVSPDHLWWPPFKVSGRYLSPWLAGTEGHARAGAARALDRRRGFPAARVAREPMALDPHRGIDPEPRLVGAESPLPAIR